MGILVKVLFGAAVVGGAGVAVAVAVDNHQDKKARQKVKDSHSDVEIARAKKALENRREKSIVQRIKKYVEKKVVKILAVVALHMEQIEAIGAIIGLGSAFIGIASAIKDFKNGNDTQEKLDMILEKMKLDEEAINHNNKVFAVGMGYIADKLDVDSDELNAALDAIA